MLHWVRLCSFLLPWLSGLCVTIPTTIWIQTDPSTHTVRFVLMHENENCDCLKLPELCSDEGTEAELILRQRPTKCLLWSMSSFSVQVDKRFNFGAGCGNRSLNYFNSLSLKHKLIDLCSCSLINWYASIIFNNNSCKSSLDQFSTGARWPCPNIWTICTCNWIWVNTLSVFVFPLNVSTKHCT